MYGDRQYSLTSYTTSRYWAHHLALTDEAKADHKDLVDYITDFLRIRIIFWIEAMNLLGCSGQCATMLQSARGWILKVRILSSNV